MRVEDMVFTMSLGELAELPGSPYAYWAPRGLRELFKKYPPLDRDVVGKPDAPKVADVKVGLQTSDDPRFVRFFWEVPASEIAVTRDETLQGKKWVPFAKGGSAFFHDINLVVNWGKDGKEIKNFRRPDGKLLSRPQNESFYFRAGLAWARIASSIGLEAWRMPPGVFSVSALALFLPGEDGVWEVLSLLNSRLTTFQLFALQPLVHDRHIGYVSQIPFSQNVLHSAQLRTAAREAYELLCEWATGDETATVFVAPWMLQAWWGVSGGAVLTGARPATSHPLGQDFNLSDWPAAKRIRGLPGELLGGTKTSLEELARICVRQEEMLRARIREIQDAIDEEVFELYEVPPEERAVITRELALHAGETPRSEGADDGEEVPDEDSGVAPQALLGERDHIVRLLTHLVREIVCEDEDGILPLRDIRLADRIEAGLVSQVEARMRRVFGDELGNGFLGELRTLLGVGLDEWLWREFWREHISIYQRRPIIWELSSEQLRRRGDEAPAFACFLWWHRLDTDTLRKVRAVYLPPVLHWAQDEVERAERMVLEASQAGDARAKRRREEEWQRAVERSVELQAFAEALGRLTGPEAERILAGHWVDTRSAWVRERVAEITRGGYKPVRDYGVRVNIEPLKAARLLPREGDRIK